MFCYLIDNKNLSYLGMILATLLESHVVMTR